MVPVWLRLCYLDVKTHMHLQVLETDRVKRGEASASGPGHARAERDYTS